MLDNTLIIREVSEKDFPAIKNMIMRASSKRFVQEQVPEGDIKEIEEKYTPENLKTRFHNNFYYVAELTPINRVVGIAGLKKDDRSEIYNRLSTFYIDPYYQGKGIGRKLYEQVKQKALEMGCMKMVVSSSPLAEPIYEHFGFKRIRVDWKEHSSGRKSCSIWMENTL